MFKLQFLLEYHILLLNYNMKCVNKNENNCFNQ